MLLHYAFYCFALTAATTLGGFFVIALALYVLVKTFLLAHLLESLHHLLD